VETVNIDRLMQDIEELSQIGRHASGRISRPSFSPEDREARFWLSQKITEAGLALHIDEAGNIFGRLSGQGPAVISGSHLDTIPNGGKFDGALGVLTALECCRVIKEKQLQIQSPLEVVAFSDEEDHYLGFLGSYAFTGKLDMKAARLACNPEGLTLAEAMAQCGLDIEKVAEARRHPEEIKAFIELHIEQGPILDTAKMSIGVVHTAMGNYRYGIKMTGLANHAGFPMQGRQDSCLGAVHLIETIRNYQDQLKPETHLTVGIFKVLPGLENVIPGETYFSVDFREEGLGVLQNLESYVAKSVKEIASQYGLRAQIDPLLKVDPLPFYPEILETIQHVSDELGIKWQPIASGAGHDAQIVGQVAPTAMIFVPSAGGRSHCPEEYTRPEDIEKGANVLLHTLLRLAQ